MNTAIEKKYTYKRDETGAFDIPCLEKPIAIASNPEFRREFLGEMKTKLRKITWAQLRKMSSVGRHRVVALVVEVYPDGYIINCSK